MHARASCETISLFSDLKAAHHHGLAALHYNEAATHRKIGNFDRAAHHAHIAHEHLLQARLIILNRRKITVVESVGPPFAA